jgi:hypothetical protein
MTNVQLISEAKIRQYTDMNDNVDSKLIVNAIREAQDIELQRILGTLLYNKIIDDVQNSTLTGAYKTLVDDYVQNFLLYAVYYVTLEAIYLRPRNNGLLIPNGGENSDSADRSMYNVKRQSVKNKSEFYAEKLSQYLIENQGTFPELGQNVLLYQQVADFGEQYKSPIVMKYNTYSPHLKNLLKMGFKVYDTKYPYLPQ